MKNPKVAFKWDLLGSRKWVGELADRLPVRSITSLTPSFKRISFRDITIEHCDKVIDLIGIPETPVTQVLMNRIFVKDSKDLISVRDVDGLIISNSEISSTDNRAEFTGTKNIMFINTIFHVPNERIQTSYEDAESLPLFME